MKYSFNKTKSFIAALSGMLAVWSPSSYACSDTPVLASICIMATPATFGNFNRQYVAAAGQQLPISQNTALYSLIGITYGGNGQTTFNLPDLRGKVIVGANTTNYPAGETGGQETVTLTVAQLPPHNFQIAAIPVDLSKVTATTTLTGLSATANLAGVTISGPATGLVMNVSTAPGGASSPSGNYLGKPFSSTTSPYSTVAPSGETLNSGAISGNLSLTIPSGVTAPVNNIIGTPATVIGGTATASGTTNTIGTGAALPTMPPYLALTYYIATSGIYPSRD